MNSEKNSNWLSYKRDLDVISQNIEINNIFEYGPGQSTQHMLKLFPNAHITSLEHDSKYYHKARESFGNETRVDLYHVPLGRKRGNGYVTFPLELMMRGYLKACDLVFVDGRERHSCLVIAKYIMSNNGIVIVHDSGRQRYRNAFDLYKFVYDSKDPRSKNWTSLLSDTVDIKNWYLPDKDVICKKNILVL